MVAQQMRPTLPNSTSIRNGLCKRMLVPDRIGKQQIKFDWQN